MSKHLYVSPRFSCLSVVFLLIFILTGCSKEYGSIGPALEGKESITGGSMLLLAGRPGGVGTSDGIGTFARFNAPRGIAVYGDTLYIADKSNHTIRKMDLTTKSVTTIAGYPGRPGVIDGIGSNARFYYPEGIATDGVYLYVADAGNHVIRKVEINSGSVVTLAGKRGQSGYHDGIGVNAMFNAPSGITVRDNMLYVADTDNHLIRRVNKNSGEATTIAGTETVAGKTDGRGASAQFNFPFGITSNGEFLYIADTYNHSLRRLSIPTGEVITLAGKSGESGYRDGSLLDSRFFYPSDLEIKGNELFIADLGNDLIRVIDLPQGTVNVIAGTPRVPGSADGPVGIGSFNSPADVAITGDYIYVTDMDNNSIRSVNMSTGEIATDAGTPSYIGSTDDSGYNSRFSTPGGIAMEGSSLYIADTFNHTIRKVDAETGAVTTIAGKAGVSGTTDSSESAAVFNSPMDVIADANGEFIYIVDTGNHVIRSMNIATGEVRSFAGYPGSFGTANGVGTTARFNSPKRGVRIGEKLYVVDTGNHAIRVINLNTSEVTTLAGERGVAGSADTGEGPGGGARFYNPGDITTDGVFLYVADTGNHVIRKVHLSSGVVSTVAGIRGGAGLVDSIDGSPLLETCRKQLDAVPRRLVDSGGGSPLFKSPEGITWHNGILYVSDTGNNVLRKIDLATRQVSFLAGDVTCVEEIEVENGVDRTKRTYNGEPTGTSAFGDSTDGTGKTTSFNAPSGINTDGVYLYVMDSGTNRVRRVQMDTGETKSFSFSRHKGISLNSPAGGDLTGGILYIADNGNHIVRKLEIATLNNAPLILIAGNLGISGYGYSAGYSASFYNPVGITADGMGNLYVADTGNHTIRKVVISTGEVTTVAGIPARPGFMNSEFGYPMFFYPRGICIIGNHLYVADSGSHLVRRVNLSTGWVGLVAGLSDYVTNVGSPGTSDSTGAAAGFSDPRGIATDGKYLYVTDSGNHTIRRILAATGQVRTIAGMPSEAGYRDDISFNARFNYPRGITVDGDYLYVADTGNNVFRRVNKVTGEVLTFSGKKGESSFIQGTRDNARYNNVVSVTTSAESPYLYFTDSAENVVGRIEK
ncbi:MAG TPA: hypothetical protein VFF47_04815 [Nitrospirota bacterium]|nr:hypothetical protein [Nitrospirota bacterium]